MAWCVLTGGRRAGRRKRRPAAAGAFLAAAVGAAMLAAGPPPARADALLDKPIYDPETKSYFELKKGVAWGYWKNALKSATQHSYKGVRGRLAIIPSQETNDRIFRGLHLNQLDYPNVWIGIQYWCKAGKLMLSNGAIHSLKAYANWDTPWYRKKSITCRTLVSAHEKQSNRSKTYMPVSILTDSGKWQASGPKKGYQYYLVEYPTGGQ